MMKAKLITLRVVVFLLVLAALTAGVVYLLIDNPFYVAHDSGAYLKVWLDENGNGQREAAEPFLPDICVWAGSASMHPFSWQEICGSQALVTDNQGAWSAFFPGASCTEIYSAVNPPDGYFLTTPAIVNGCTAEFGLSREKPASAAELPDIRQYLQQVYEQELRMNWLKLAAALAAMCALAAFISIKVIRPKAVN